MIVGSQCYYTNEFIKEQSKYPLKCTCGCNETEKYNVHYDVPYGEVEYHVKCKTCGTYLGSWSYGVWHYIKSH